MRQSGLYHNGVEHHLSEEKLACPKCGGAMMEIGREVCHRIKIIPAQVTVVKVQYYTYHYFMSSSVL